jgi:threonine/homoserine/homoserine lactone efflux protein
VSDGVSFDVHSFDVRRDSPHNHALSLPIWGFVAVTVPLVLSPGATTAVVLRSSLAGGSRAGVLTAAGANAASCGYGLLTAFGFSAALQRWPDVWLALRWAGVAYLCWLGGRSIRRALLPPGSARAEAARGDTSPWRGVLTGFLTNLLNPSLTAFYLIVIPQFIPHDEPFARAALTLTAIHVSLAFSWHVAWAAAGATLARVLSRRRPRQVLEIATGVALLVLAAAVAL